MLENTEREIKKGQSRETGSKTETPPPPTQYVLDNNLRKQTQIT